MTLFVKNGKHHAVVKTVGKLPAPTAHGHVASIISCGVKPACDRCDTSACDPAQTQAVAAADVAAHTAAGEILARTAVLTAHEHGVVELGGLGAQVVDAGTLGAALAIGAGIVQLNAGTVGQVANRLRELRFSRFMM